MREGERLKAQMEERDHEVAKLMRRLEVRMFIGSVLPSETFSSRSQLSHAINNVFNEVKIQDLFVFGLRNPSN